MGSRIKADSLVDTPANRLNGSGTGVLNGLFSKPVKTPKPSVGRDQQMTTKVELITPKKATEYLKRNTRNRKVRPRRVEYFSRMLTSGQFQLSHQGIAFAPDGSLTDGQHRLLSIDATGISAYMNVTRNAPESSVPIIDLPEVRTIADLAGALGVSTEFSNQMVAVGKQMRYSVNPVFTVYKTMSNEAWIKYILLHEQAIRYSIESISTTHIRHCAFRSVVARAWYTVDLARLDEFCDVLSTGIVDSRETDGSAIKIRDMYLNSKRTFGGNAGRVLLYRKTETALQAFLKSKNLLLIREVNAEIFTIPGDE